MRKFAAGLLIRAAHRICRPTVTETSPCADAVHIIGASGKCPCEKAGSGSGVVYADSTTYVAGPVGPAMQAQPHVELTDSGWVLPVSQASVDHVSWMGRRA